METGSEVREKGSTKVVFHTDQWATSHIFSLPPLESFYFRAQLCAVPALAECSSVCQASLKY